MKSTNHDNPMIGISVRLYRVSLHAYPTKFQQEYGSEMMQVFQDCCVRAVRQNGVMGFSRLWAITLLDFLHSVVEQHLHKETDLSNSRLSKWSGWLFILGAFAFLAILQGSVLLLPASLISSILLAAGLLGLRARYGEQVGSFGKHSLLVGACGALLFVIVIASMVILYSSGALTESQVSRGLWILLIAGPALVLSCLTLFGLACLRSNPLPGPNWLTGVVGIWYPLGYFFLVGYIFTHDGTYPQQYSSALQVMFLIQGLALCVFGFILITDSHQEWQWRDPSNPLTIPTGQEIPLKKEMKPEIIREAGWAFILGAFAFITILQGSDAIAIPGSELGAILLAAGLLGLRARYGEQVGGLGRNSLLFGASGPLLLVIFVATGLAGIVSVGHVEKGLWILLFGGPAIALLGLTLFGADASRNKPMPRLNWLPLVAGFWYPVAYLILASFLFTHDGVLPPQYWPGFQIIFGIQAIALCVFGFVLITEARQEMATA